MKNICAIILLILFLGQLSYAQQIRGKVVDEDQQPLPGVSITIGSTVQAITDSAGFYSFKTAHAFANLSFSHIGYLPATIFIKGNPPVIILNRYNSLLPATIVRSFERNSQVINIPAAVSVLSKTDLERYGSMSFVPAINTVAGVKMDERSPGSYRLSIRGNILRSTFGVRNVKVYWNGIPFTDANGTTYLNELALNNAGRIEILKGPSGSMYGAGPGGVVLLSSDPGEARQKNLALQVSGGSYGMFAAGTAFHQAVEKSNINFSFSHQQADGYRVNTRMRRDAGNFTGTFFINSRQKLHTNVFYSDLFYQTPGGLTAAELDANPKQARPATGAFPGAVSQKAALYLKTFYVGFADEIRFNERWSNKTSVFASTTDFKNPTIRNYEKKTEQGIGFRSVSQYKNQFFTGTAGAEYQYGSTKSNVYGNKSGAVDTLQYKDEINARQLNIFIQGDFSIAENFILNTGISYNTFYYGFLRTSQFPLHKEARHFAPGFIPRISLLKKINKTMSAYAAVSKGFSPPSIEEVRGGSNIFNKDLNAETGINYEAGIKGDIIKNKFTIDAGIYYFSLQNTIVSRRDSAGGDYFINAGSTKQYGLEAASSYLAIDNNNRFFRKVKIWCSYTGIRARFDNYQQGAVKYDGNKLTGTVPRLFSAGADVNTASFLYANLTWSYTGTIPLNDANDIFSKPYNLIFIKTGFKKSIFKNINADIFMSYDRSFNTPYSLGNDLNAAANRFYNPSSPENIYAGIQLKFIL